MKRILVVIFLLVTLTADSRRPIVIRQVVNAPVGTVVIHWSPDDQGRACRLAVEAMVKAEKEEVCCDQ